ncbi:glycosyltransferase family 9 protein [Burkholderia alba]|uniref:glycosyltransferase family 9 protein n=1 Tax=Burkholderia alba TaxID=2683677 RepID=UPI002B0590AB|nr:glycosyltransferase family 9 protein [Burkholderia alba]
MQTTPDALASAYTAYLDHPDCLTGMQLARVLRTHGHAQEAIGVATRWADALDTPLNLAQMGVEMNFLGMFAEAQRLLARSIPGLAHDPNLYVVKFELTISLYAQGKYHEAHALYREIRDKAWRDTIVDTLYPVRNGDQYAWAKDKFLGHDDPVSGKRVLVMMEGGVGDLFMYSRYFEMLKREGALSVHVQIVDSARGVLHEDDCIRTVGELGSLPHDCDCVTWFFNLFARYQTSPYFPSQSTPYIPTPPAHALPEPVRAALAPSAGGPRVGLVWRSGTGVRHEPYRSLPLRALEPLLGTAGYRFYALQVGALDDEERDLYARRGIVDLGPDLHSFADTAAVLGQLDLIVSIDTGTAHLAGAMGRPVWLMLSQAGDSRWFDCRRHTPWYPTMRLFRQTALGDWRGPVAAMTDTLAAGGEPGLRLRD